MTGCRLLNLLTPLRATSDQLRRHLLWLLVIRVFFFTLLLGVTMVLATQGTPVILPPPAIIVAFIAILFIFSIGSAAMLQKKGLRLVRFGTVQILADILFAALLLYGTGCSQSIFTPILILPVISGGLILNWKGGLMAAAFATLLYGSVLVLELNRLLPAGLLAIGFVPMNSPFRAANLFAVYGTTFFVIALVAGILAARMHRIEEELTRTSREFDRLSLLYKQIFDDISTGIITVDDTGTVTSANAAAGRITGYEPRELIGRRLDHQFPGLRLHADSGIRQVTDLQRRDGTMIRAGYSLSSLNLPPEPEGGPADCTNCKIVTLQDISTIEKMEQRVREAEKMAAIGELSASVAHDFRNPLAAISGSAQMLVLEDGSSPETVQSLSTIILRETRRMARTITDFLQFARPAPVQAEWFDLSRLIREAIETSEQARFLLDEGKITVSVPANMDGYGDQQLLQTCLIHLLDNAAVHVDRETGRIEVAAREETRDREPVLVLAVKDNGPGIDEAIRERIMQPFFSTRENGTGLGLSIVQQIMEQHRGQLEVDSVAGRGCTMRLILPLPQS